MQRDDIFHKAESIRDVIRYVRRFKNATVVIHIDDDVISSRLFSAHIRDIALIHEAGLRIAIVPGARRHIDENLTACGISWTIKGGYRITDESAISAIKTAAFDVSNIIMTHLAAEKLTAVIGNWVRARGKGVIDGVDYGTAGETDRIQTDTVRQVLENGLIPIFPCIGWSAAGKPYNISSVELAAQTAVRLGADKLFFLTPRTSITPEHFSVPEQIGLSPENCVPAMNMQELEDFLKVNPADSGLRDFRAETVKLLETAGRVCRAGVSRVHILNASIDGSIPCEIFSNLGSGTMIYENNYGGIRAMKRKDIPAVLRLMQPFIEKGILLPRSEAALSETYHDYIVYELDGSVRSCAALYTYGDGQAEIAAVAVDASCAHIGIGPKMMTYLMDKARKTNVRSIFVLTTQTADWFEQQGFVPSDISTLPEKRKREWDPRRGSKLFRLKL